MKLIVAILFCFNFQQLGAQKLDINTLERITYSSVRQADSMLNGSKFRLTEKQSGKGYTNYYYTSYERKELFEHMLRSLSFMDVYNGTDTSRLVLYRTYYKDEYEEMEKQLIDNGYEMQKQSGNELIYKKAGYTIISKISDKKVKGAKTMTAYEFELGR
jgi:hypothetical protein